MFLDADAIRSGDVRRCRVSVAWGVMFCNVPAAVDIGLLQVFQNNHWNRNLSIWRINRFFPKPELVVSLSSINLFSLPYSLHSKLYGLGAQHSFLESASRTPTLLKLALTGQPPVG